ncbi:MAG: hypothetical protein ACYDE0_00590 [Acidiferrobacterales bacterium]
MDRFQVDRSALASVTVRKNLSPTAQDLACVACNIGGNLADCLSV